VVKTTVLALAFFSFTLPANALDGTPSPNNPMPIVKPAPLDLPFGRPTACGYAGVCLSSIYWR
jgi:hypothetical protein